MKTLGALLALSSLYFGLEPEPLFLRVTFSTFNKCAYSGRVPCIKLGDVPIKLVFRPNDEVQAVTTEPDSEVYGVMVIVKHSPKDNASAGGSCPAKDIERTCFVVKSVNTLVLLPPGMGLETEPVVSGGQNMLIVIPQKL